MSTALGFVDELCLALVHSKRTDASFMIFTAYFDESNTHGKAPDLIVAGFLGNVSQWRKFEKRLAKLQKRFGFTIFHYKEFKSGSGEFRGWSDTKKNKLIEELISLCRKLEQGVTVSITWERFQEEYKRDLPRKMPPDSQLGICFRSCLGFIIDKLDSRIDGLHIVFEHGHDNLPNCERIFFEIKNYEETQGRRLLRTFTSAKKKDSLPLMMGDLLGATHLNMKRAGAEISSLRMLDQTYRPGVIAFLEIAEGGLQQIKSNFERARAAKKEKYSKDVITLASDQRPIS